MICAPAFLRSPIMRGAMALALAASVCAGLPADAQEASSIAVNATEIDRGSRLEIPIEGAPFAVTRVGPRRLDVTLVGADQNFDVSQLSLGGLARNIASARSSRVDEGASLTLILNCDCAYATGLRNGMLTIDILADAASSVPPKADNGAADGEAAPIPAAAPVRKGQAPWPGTAHAPRRAPVPPPRGVALAAGVGEAAERESPNPELALDNAEEDPGDVLIARQRLLEQLTRAADQGLLEFDGEHVDRPGGILPSARALDAKVAEPSEDESAEVANVGRDEAEHAEAETSHEAPAPAAPPRELAVRARTASDRDFTARRADTFAAPVECPEPAALALPAPLESGNAFSAATAALRAEVVDEFGAPAPKVITRLARHYIAHGFGAEARFALTLLDDAHGAADPHAWLKIRKERALLGDMARIIESEPLTSDGALTEVAACGGLAGLWAEAGGAVRGAWARDPIYSEDVAEAFDDAPAWIRVALGPRLIESRVALGDPMTAQRFADILGRTPGAAGPATDLARARLLASYGDLDGARTMLKKLAGLRTPESESALLALAESYGPGDPPPVGFAALLSEAAWLSEGGALAGRLKLAEIRMIELTDGAPAALDAIRAAMTRPGFNRAVLTDAGHGVLESVAERARSTPAEGVDPGAGAERLALVRTIEAYAPYISTGHAGDRARAAAANALTGLGLATLALDMLAPVDERRDPALAEAAARARALVSEGEAAPAETEADIVGTADAPGAEAEIQDPTAAALAEAQEALAAARAARSRLEETLRDG